MNSRSFFLSVLVLSVCLLLSNCKKIDPSDWMGISTAVSERLQRVQFVNDMRGFIVGGQRYDADRILRTSDGGQNWELLDSLTGKTLFDLDFADDQRGFVSGFDGKILRTLDGGDSWSVSQLYYWMPMHGIAIASDSLVVSVGGNGYNSGQIVRSTNFGTTWELVDTFSYEFRDVLFTDELTGYACGYSVIFKTTDGGLSWNFTPADREFFNTLAFPTAQTGYAAGRSGSILRTTDAGESWKFLRRGNRPFADRHYYNDMVFLDENTGYLVGDKGLVVKTNDGGKTWRKFDIGVDDNLYGISIMEEGRGFVVGENGMIFEFRE